MAVFLRTLRWDGRGDAGGDGDSCRWTVLRCGSFRHMDVEVPVFKDAIVYAEQVDMRLDVLQGDDGRLLHHVAEISG